MAHSISSLLGLINLKSLGTGSNCQPLDMVTCSATQSNQYISSVCSTCTPDPSTVITHDNISLFQRIVEALPTIKHILDNNPQCVILASHLGRPNGKVCPNLSLRPVSEALKDLLG